MEMHTGLETLEPFPLERADVPDDKVRLAQLNPKPVLRSDIEGGYIAIDSETTLRGVPRVAWGYRPGNRSAIEWVLDQHKEKRPMDPIILEKLDSYRFCEHKERVIDLLVRVVTVSIRTVAISAEKRVVER